MTGGGRLADVERMVWRMSGWRVTDAEVDALLEAVRGHVRAHGVVCECPVAPKGRTRSAQGARAGLTGGSGGSSVPEPVKTAHRGAQGPAPHMVTDPDETARICRVCLAIRPIGEFSRTTHGTRGRRNACRGCEAERKRSGVKA